jgi:hypothetical protein
MVERASYKRCMRPITARSRFDPEQDYHSTVFIEASGLRFILSGKIRPCRQFAKIRIMRSERSEIESLAATCLSIGPIVTAALMPTMEHQQVVLLGTKPAKKPSKNLGGDPMV